MTVNISPVAHLRRHATFHPDRTAIIYEDRIVSYRELHAHVGSLATSLAGRGVTSGDRIAYLGQNSLTFMLALLSSAWIGATFVPLNFRLAPPEVAELLHNASPSVIIAEPAHAATLDVASLPGDAQLFVVDDDPAAGDAGPHLNAWAPFSPLLHTPDEATPARVLTDDDLALILYTSGTTGHPKGVMLTHGNLWWNVLNMDSFMERRFDDVYLSVAPLFHIGTLNTFTLGAIARGATNVIRRTFDPAATLRDLTTLPVNGVFAVAAMYQAIARTEGFAEADLSHLRLAVAAGAPVPPALLETYQAKGVPMQQAWGLTETAPCATYLEAAQAIRKVGSAGIPMPYGDVRVSDLETLEPVTEPGVLGELWVRGPNVSIGYWDNPEATTGAFLEDGWFRSGDIGYRDTDGYFYIVDRLKDMIISGGENIYPAEIERVLNAHPDLIDAAVVGSPDEKWGEVVVAVVCVTYERTVLLEDLREFCSARIARYKLPTRMLVLDELPRNGTGKLDKMRIREIVRSAESAAS